MTDLTTKLAEALGRLIDVSMVAMTDKDFATEQSIAIWNEAIEALAAYEAAQAMSPKSVSGTSGPVTDKQLLAEAEFAESYDASAPSFMSLLRDDAVVGDFQRRLLICMRAAVKLAAPVAQAEPWQPIETAPKGAPVLVCCAHGIYVAEWCERDIEYWHVDDNKHGPFPLRGQAPSHWMPLPQPPKENNHE